ncbi:MAG: Cof-type HAD-IIB family hydrolase [Erysipelotrichaceae bacterium]|nr:Cof-type HAD-IIB family hydrolase [Erysipelotrichaceae bacterium]
MKEDVRLLICDIDGTLTEKGGKPMKITEEALRKFHEEGVLIGLASGRPVDHRTIGKFKEWGYGFDPDIVIGFNGCEVWDRMSGKKREYSFLPKEDVKEILDYMWPLDVNPVVYEDGYDHVLAKRSDHIIEASMKRNEGTVEFCDKERFCLHDVPKIEFRYIEEDMEDIVMKTANEHKCDRYIFIKSFYGTLEYMKPGIDKGVALKRICEELDIPLDKVVACGDMDNDIAMLEAAGTGICLLNGSEATKKAAAHITEEDVLHDGLGKFLLKHYF